MQQADTHQSIDLTRATVVCAAVLSSAERKAIAMLLDGIQKRTQIRLVVCHEWPSNAAAVIAIGQSALLGPIAAPAQQQLPGGDESKPEAFRVRISAGTTPTVWVNGNDPRGVLFGVGYLLRKVCCDRQRITLPIDAEIQTSPRMPLRGHQLGYRPANNTYDAWDVPDFEQYLRDLAIFGCNAIELIPPESDDDADSPHFPLPPIQMMSEISRLANDYDMAVWVWYPALEADYSDPTVRAQAIGKWGQVLASLPRLDAVFVPGGDPGHTAPRPLMAMLDHLSAELRRHHPRATLWLSPQEFSDQWLAELREILLTEPPWLAGLVYGPWIRITLDRFREMVPPRYPIRNYPDITHSRECQFPVPGWHWAFGLTQGREISNPRPIGMRHIFRAMERHTSGFITYSEGAHDDVNKALWSAWGWDPDADVNDILRDYARWFISPRVADTFAQGLLSLERNWQGPPDINSEIDTTLEQFQAMEQAATPQIRRNWRFQLALYRAHFDAFIRARLVHETHLEREARGVLEQAGRLGSKVAMDVSQAILDRSSTEPVGGHLRARAFELAEMLFQGIGMQLSVQRHLARDVLRGANLDEIDWPLNDRLWLIHRFRQIRQLTSESDRLAEIERIVLRTNNSAGGFYDSLGDVTRQPHLVQTPWQNDPSFHRNAAPSISTLNCGGKLLNYPHAIQAGLAEPVPHQWWHNASAAYGRPLQMRYTGLDPYAQYRLRVVYPIDLRGGALRLTANDRFEIHSFVEEKVTMREYDIPQQATALGELVLSWMAKPGEGCDYRRVQVAEVWLMRAESKRP